MRLTRDLEAAHFAMVKRKQAAQDSFSRGLSRRPHLN
jgi:hypothetical protein